MQFFHGTIVVVADAITAAGLVEPWPGRGVSLTPDRAYAARVAEAACLRDRAEHSGHERQAVGLVVVFDLDGLDVWPTGMLDPWSPTSVVTAAVGPERVVDLQTFAVELPPRGSPAERLELATGGIAVRRRSRLSEPTLERARRLYAKLSTTTTQTTTTAAATRQAATSSGVS